MNFGKIKTLWKVEIKLTTQEKEKQQSSKREVQKYHKTVYQTSYYTTQKTTIKQMSRMFLGSFSFITKKARRKTEGKSVPFLHCEFLEKPILSFICSISAASMSLPHIKSSSDVWRMA